jgi:hypothetical protein
MLFMSAAQATYQIKILTWRISGADYPERKMRCNRNAAYLTKNSQSVSFLPQPLLVASLL